MAVATAPSARTGTAGVRTGGRPCWRARPASVAGSVVLPLLLRGGEFGSPPNTLAGRTSKCARGGSRRRGPRPRPAPDEVTPARPILKAGWDAPPSVLLSAAENALGRGGRLRVRQPCHPEAVEEAEQRRDQRDEQRDLKRSRPHLRVDVQDLVLDRRR